MSDTAAGAPLLLAEACPVLVEELRNALLALARADLAGQLARLALPAQAIAATPEQFSFMVDLLPALSREQVAALEFRDWEAVELPLGAGAARLMVDEFGRIAEFTLTQRADLHRSLKALRGHIGPQPR